MTMMIITLNGEEKTISKQTSLQDAITAWQLTENHFAIAINEQFIPKSNYASTLLADGDAIELLVPMQGG